MAAHALLEFPGALMGFGRETFFRGASQARAETVENEMKIVCAWCNKKIGGKGTLLSHGICKKCLLQLKQPQFDFMQKLPVSPSPSLRIRMTNRGRPVRAAGRQQPALRLLG